MNTISCIFTLTAALFLPLGIVIWLFAKGKGYQKPVLLGALTFLVFQMLLRIPLIQLVLPRMQWFIVMNTTQPLMSALFYGLTAALFEEGGRYLVMRNFMKNRQLVSDGIVFGIGHGGIEAILFAGINALVTLVIADKTVSAGLMFAGGIERLSVMVCHVAWSVMVLKSIREKKSRWLFAAFGLHALLDTGLTLVSNSGISTFEMELVLGGFALIMLFYIIYRYKSFKEKK